MAESFFELSRQRYYGALELNRSVGRNLLKGLGISVLVHIAVLGSWFLFSHFAEKPRQQSLPRVVVLDPIKVHQPPAKDKVRTGESGRPSGGETEAAEVAKRVRAIPRLRSIVEDSRDALVSRMMMIDATIELTHPGEPEDPPIDLTRRDVSDNRFTRLSTEGTGGEWEEFAGGDYGAELGSEIGSTGGIAGDFTGEGGMARGFGRNANSADAYGMDGSGHEESTRDAGQLLAEAKRLAMPAKPDSASTSIAVVNLSKFRGVAAPPQNVSPVVEWIATHEKTLPVTLQKPEVLNQKPGDVTTWVDFDDEYGRHYTLFLLGRYGHPAQLNMFLVTGGWGTLLQDEGVKGESEVYKHGTATGNPNNPTVQLELLSPSQPEAKKMMRVFTAWWNQIKAIEKL